MADELNKSNLRIKIIESIKTLTSKVENLVHYGTANPTSYSLTKLWVKQIGGRFGVKYILDNQGNNIDLNKTTVISNTLSTSFMLSENYGTGEGTPMYGLWLEQGSINGDIITITVPTAITSVWNASDIKTIDESLSYFENTVTGKRISFNSFYKKGLNEVEFTSDSVKLTFDTGLTLTDWKCRFCIKYVG